MFNKRNGIKSTNSSISGNESVSRSTERNDTPRRGPSTSRLGQSFSSPPRIDPEILLDTQSNGLSSRIVKYYEDSQKMTRSPRHIYNKPGQFPIVHLKRKEIEFSVKRNNPLSAVKIAPPDKSVADRNIRLNILRQGLSPPSTPAEDYREPRKLYDNEPLAPSAGIESTPTRSVLDALTEISRKRIHNEDFNGERTKKKPCKECTEIDGPLPDETRANQTKRQREKISPPSPSEATIAESTKKKLCRDSADILSSLSSSVRLLNPKRRIEDVLVGDAKRKHFQRPQATVEPQKRSPIAPVESREVIDSPTVQKVVPNVSPTPKYTSPTIPPKPTPKITLFNQNYDKIQERVLSDTEDDEEGRSMNLVRPKQNSQFLVKDKKASKEGTKSKLAMMLSYLSRNFEDESPDAVDGKTDSKDESTPQAPLAAEKSPELPKIAPVIFETPKSSKVAEISLTKASTEQKELTKDAPVATSTPMFKFGVSSTTSEASKKVESTENGANSMIEKDKQVENKVSDKKLEENTASVPTSANTSPFLLRPAVSDASKVQSVATPPKLAAPINFGFNPQASTAATSTAPTTSSSPLRPVGNYLPTFGGSTCSPKTSSPFTLGISGNSTNSLAKETGEFPKTLSTSFSVASKAPTSTVATTTATAANPPAVQPANFMQNFATTSAAPSSVSLSTGLSSTGASNPPAYPANSLFTFKPVASSAPVATVTSSVTNSSGNPPQYPSFGTPVVTKAAPAESKFVFGSTTSTFGDTSKTTQSTGIDFKKPDGVITFGGGNVAKTTPSTNTFNSLPCGGYTEGTFSGFSKPATAPTFGNPSASISVFGSQTISSPAFGGSSTTTTSVFGHAPVTSTSAFGASVSQAAAGFGGQNTAASVFGSPATTTPSFGSTAASTPAFGTPSTSASVFGTPAATSAPTFGTPSTSAPIFGTPATSSSTFGGATTAASTFGVPKSSTDTKSLFTFGATTNNANQTSQNSSAFVFNASQAKSPQTSAATPFSFEKKTPFEAAASAGSTSLFGGSTNSSIFGGTATTTANATAPVFGSSSGVAVFGAATTSAPATTSATSIFSAGNAFGGTGQQQQAASNEWGKSAFGTTSTGSQFSFGQTATTTASAASGAGIFGQAQSQTTGNTFGEQTNKPFNFTASAGAPFQFGGASSAPNNASFSFSGNQNTAAPAPAFGGGASSGPFAFGLSTQAAQAEQSKPPLPAFGSGVTVFGGGQQNATGNAPPAFGTPNPAPAFNFTGSNPTTPQQPFAFGATNAQGGFSIGSSGGPTQRRSYRQATRRIK
ncbi:mucin-19 isoform X2 [Lutzomyia longipalpis]|uniref:mucin-19 isoform X2 n=1 Tax=Lutzomyia longipalpis TaxID=7200 RepID=UPI0024841FD9|nr:mucin-19 isoform X2 [Lutzomyia longipalpis]